MRIRLTTDHLFVRGLDGASEPLTVAAGAEVCVPGELGQALVQELKAIAAPDVGNDPYMPPAGDDVATLLERDGKKLPEGATARI